MSSALRVVTITVEELEQLVEAAVRRALGSRSPSEWLSAEECAELLRCKRSAIPTLVSRDGLPASRVGRSYRFKRAEVEAWLVERSERPRGHARRHGERLLRIRGGRT